MLREGKKKWRKEAEKEKKKVEVIKAWREEGKGWSKMEERVEEERRWMEQRGGGEGGRGGGVRKGEGRWGLMVCIHTLVCVCVCVCVCV